MDATAIYYTLSTIAQTLAGALAVLVAFVLFRLSALFGTIRTAQNILKDPFGQKAEEAWPVLAHQGPEALKTYIETSGRTRIVLMRDSTWWKDCEAAYLAWQERRRTLPRVYAALSTTAIDIGLCFVALPFTPAIARSPITAWTILGIASGLGVVCVALYVWLIAGIVGTPSE